MSKKLFHIFHKFKLNDSLMNSSGNPNYSILGDGSVTYPAQQFVQEYNTGVYREIYADTTSSTGSSTSLAFTKKGNKRLRITDTGGDLYGDWNVPAGTGSLSLDDGSATAPSLNFTSETDLGLYKAGSGSLGIASRGSVVAALSSTGITSLVPLTLPEDTVSLPSILFQGTTQSAISTNGAGALRLFADVNGSGSVLTVAPTQISATGPIHASDGSLPAPEFSFSNENGLGLFRAGTNVLAIASNGQVPAEFSSTVNSFNVPLLLPQDSSIPSLEFAGTTTSAISSNTTGTLTFKCGTTTTFVSNASGLVSSLPISAPSFQSNSGAQTFLASSGSASGPSFSFTTDNTGLYKPANSELGISLSGTPSFLYTTTGNTSFAPIQFPLVDMDKILFYNVGTDSKIDTGTGWNTNYRSGSTGTNNSGAHNWYTVNGSGSWTNRMILSNNGTLALQIPGTTFSIPTGSNACAGTGATMVAGTVTVATTAVQTSDIIFLMKTANGGTTTIGYPAITISNGVSFTLTGGSLDTSTWSWIIFHT